jgi:hypothetical protein
MNGMQMMPKWSRWLATVTMGLLLLPGCNSDAPVEHLETGGDYGPVTPDMLAGARLRFRTGRDETYDDLTWIFDTETFRITAGENGLPPVLAGRLLPEGVEAREIAGNWSVENDVITFTNITADGVPTDQEPRQLETMFTGVLRIVAGPQYVFDRGQPQE